MDNLYISLCFSISFIHHNSLLSPFFLLLCFSHMNIFHFSSSWDSHWNLFCDNIFLSTQLFFIVYHHLSSFELNATFYCFNFYAGSLDELSCQWLSVKVSKFSDLTFVFVIDVKFSLLLSACNEWERHRMIFYVLFHCIAERRLNTGHNSISFPQLPQNVVFWKLSSLTQSIELWYPLKRWTGSVRRTHWTYIVFRNDPREWKLLNPFFRSFILIWRGELRRSIAISKNLLTQLYSSTLPIFAVLQFIHTLSPEGVELAWGMGELNNLFTLMNKYFHSYAFNIGMKTSERWLSSGLRSLHQTRLHE